MNNKILKLFLIVMLLFFISSCNPVLPPIDSVYEYSDYLDNVNDSFIPEYIRLSNQRGFTIKNLYGTFYIPKSIADNTVDVESKKKSTRDDRLENCIDRYAWRYGVHCYNGESANGDIPKELITSNALGVIPSEYYYSFLSLSSTYVYSVFKRDIHVFINFYNCYDVLDLDYITPFKEREYLVCFYNIDDDKATSFYSVKEEKDSIKELVSNSGYYLGSIRYIDSYYVLYEGRKIKICDYIVESLPSKGTINGKELNICSEDIRDIIDNGYVSEKFNIIDEVITDEYFGLTDGTFDKYYIETIISDNLENEESN